MAENKKDTYNVIGLMSGSSLDGLDIAYCRFTFNDGRWSFEILQTGVVTFPAEWIQEIKGLPVASAKTLWSAHAALGNYFGEKVNAFIAGNKLQGKVDLIASHGHTIFHFPEKGFTTQIGDGAAIAQQTQISVACDFRTSDIAAGGQGTPIVPIGDLHLFAGYRFCLNIGGIANISCKPFFHLPFGGAGGGRIVAFDVCAANQILNLYANKKGKEYDEGGALARSGKLNNELLEKLNALPYCLQPYPKSLDNSYSREMVLPLMEQHQISIGDKLHAYTEHIAVQIAAHIKMIAEKEKVKFSAAEKMLVTGGGAFNAFLIERIQHYTQITVEVPDDKIVKFKEALVIAFMGVLRLRNEINVLKTVTGAKHDTIGGALYSHT